MNWERKPEKYNGEEKNPQEKRFQLNDEDEDSFGDPDSEIQFTPFFPG